MVKWIGTYLILFTFCTFNNVFAQGVESDNGMSWYSFKEAGEKAAVDGKQILIFGQADWCPYCRKMIKEVYSDSIVQQTIQKYFYPVELDIESDALVYFDSTEVQEKKLAAYLRLESLPTHYFMTDNWVIFGQQPGFIPKETFLLMLTYVGSGAHTTMDFQEFVQTSAE